MKKKLVVTAAISIVLGSSAVAGASGWDGQVAECFNEVRMPAIYKTSLTLVRPASQKYVHGNHRQIQLIKYAAIYRENRAMKRPAYYVLQKANCK